MRAQALRHLCMVGDAIKGHPSPWESHDVEPVKHQAPVRTQDATVQSAAR